MLHSVHNHVSTSAPKSKIPVTTTRPHPLDHDPASPPRLHPQLEVAAWRGGRSGVMAVGRLEAVAWLRELLAGSGLLLPGWVCPTMTYGPTERCSSRISEGFPPVMFLPPAM
jgi:hypothetical protein